MENKIKVFGYVRLSEKEKNLKKGEIETSLVNQKGDIIEHCKKNNKELIHIFDGDKYVSGSLWSRRDFNDMVARALDGEAQEIICTNKNRLFRDASLFKRTIINLKNAGVKIFDITKKDYLSNESIGDIFTSTVDELKILEGVISQRRLEKRKTSEGLMFTRPPYGYVWNKSKHQKKWVIDKKNVETLKKAIEMLGNGKKLPEINKDLGISKKRYYNIRKNLKIYCGYVVFYRKIKNEKGKIIRKDLVEYKGNHEPIISEDQYNKVLKKITK